jgi:hypothetical protein
VKTAAGRLASGVFSRFFVKPDFILRITGRMATLEDPHIVLGGYRVWWGICKCLEVCHGPRNCRFLLHPLMLNGEPRLVLET